MSDDFQIAAERAETRSDGVAWILLGLHEQADAIYKQLCVLDAERAHRVPPQPVP
jgi:hypothetical protein